MRHDGCLLVIRTRKWRGRWGVPGGKIEYGERVRDALTRELREETGLELDEIHWAPVQEAVLSDEFHREAHMILLNFTATTSGGQVRLNDEAEEFRWLAPEEALRLDLNEPTRRLVERFIVAGHSGEVLS